jgi:hypothetical protein
MSASRTTVASPPVLALNRIAHTPPRSRPAASADVGQLRDLLRRMHRLQVLAEQLTPTRIHIAVLGAAVSFHGAAA